GGRFLPSPGTITRFRRPDGFGVRTDAGYEEGDTVSQFYDNLVAKLVTWGRDREAARHRMLRALAEMEITGVATTIPADVAMLSHPDFAAARHSTRWVEETLDLSGVESSVEDDLPPEVGTGPDGEPRVLREVEAEVDGRLYKVRLWVPDVSAPTLTGGAAGVRGAGQSGRSPARSRSSSHGGAGSGTVSAPMQGTIVKVLVAPGDSVDVGQAICVLEAMKMENNINATKAGTISEVSVATGDAVGPGDVLATIQ
ncbi:MAG: biotin/lipoyl-containing protein, partial [Acidimicrobiales bacterium]